MENEHQYISTDNSSEIDALRAEIMDNQARIAQLEASVAAHWAAHP